jgi:hypothetical protein
MWTDRRQAQIGHNGQWARRPQAQLTGPNPNCSPRNALDNLWISIFAARALAVGHAVRDRRSRRAIPLRQAYMWVSGNLRGLGRPRRCQRSACGCGGQVWERGDNLGRYSHGLWRATWPGLAELAGGAILAACVPERRKRVSCRSE